MRKIHILTLALVAAFAFSAVTASGALALKWLWLFEGKDVTSAITIDSVVLGKLLLEDMKAGPLKQASDIECEGTGEGTVLPEGLDEQTTALPTNCVIKSGPCTSLDKVEAVHLPWSTELLGAGTEESEALDDIPVGNGGNPGWLVECETALGKKDDTCTTAAGKTLVENESSGEVNVIFDETVEEAEEASCTEGEAHSGLVVGNITLHALLAGVLIPLSISLD
jgi:hypothetical protein